MKDLLKRLLVGTALEPMARRIHAKFTRHRGVAGATDKGHLYDIQTLEVMKRVLQEDSNCIDVGCHRGSMLRAMLRLAPNGMHFAFEPLPAMYEGLQKAFGGRSNVRLYDCALSDTAGTASFQHVVSNPGYSGLRRRRYDRPRERIQEIAVRTSLLDAVVPERTPIRFIKVDVEGAELQVFKGAVKTISQSRPVIVFEHGLGAADYYGTRSEDIYDLLVGKCGLKLFVMAEWLEDDDRGLLSRAAFREQFESGRNYYFMAAP